MFYTIIWLIVFLIAGGNSLSLGTTPFWGLVVAILADIFTFGFLKRNYLFKQG